MKALRTVLFSALAAFGLATAADVSAQQTSGAARASSGARTGATTGHHWSGGARSWSGSGHWSGGTRHWSGGHWSGHRNYWHGSRIGFYFGVPILWGAAYWGWPYYYGYGPYYYPPRTVIYRDIETYPAYPDGELGPPATTDVPPGAGAPSQGPLYMNYCESAKAYYPKVTSCPEGWKFVRPAP